MLSGDAGAAKRTWSPKFLDLPGSAPDLPHAHELQPVEPRDRTAPWRAQESRRDESYSNRRNSLTKNERRLILATKHRIFISFPVEDVNLRDFLVGQGRNERTPFAFVDMSVKQPWDSNWKSNCRSKIKGCDGVIGIVTKNTPGAGGQLWELRCAYEEDVPVLLLYGYSTDRPVIFPEPLRGRRIYTWTWENIESFLGRL
jgi:hypothetical protein